MMQDLVFLGLLKEGPKHGYEIRKIIERTISTFAELDSTSTYYTLRRLEKLGLVTKKVVRRGKRPERFVYKITPAGEKTFEKLLNDNFLTFQRPMFNIDLSLYFLPLVKSGIANSRLRGRLRGMKKILAWLEQRRSALQKQKATFHRLAIIEHQIELTRTDIAFTQKLIKNLNRSCH
jgi:DNA-binding PadR family transcriptional regulator